MYASRSVPAFAVPRRREAIGSGSGVHAFPGHIACDAASRSELVVPLLAAGEVLGVLDLDSPDLERFDTEDQAGCEALAVIVVRHLTGSVLK